MNPKQTMKVALLLLFVVAVQSKSNVAITHKDQCNACMLIVPRIVRSYLGEYEAALEKNKLTAKTVGHEKGSVVDIPDVSEEQLLQLFCLPLRNITTENLEFGCVSVIRKKYPKIKQVIESSGLSYQKLLNGDFSRQMLKEVCGPIQYCHVKQVQPKKKWGTDKCARCMTITQELIDQFLLLKKLKKKLIFKHVLQGFCDNLPFTYHNKGLYLTDDCEEMFEKHGQKLLDEHHDMEIGSLSNADEIDSEKKRFTWLQNYCFENKKCKGKYKQEL